MNNVFKKFMDEDEIHQTEKIPIIPEDAYKIYRFEDDYKEHEYQNDLFSEDWIEYPVLYSLMNDKVNGVAIRNDFTNCIGDYTQEGPNVNKILSHSSFNSLEVLYLQACFPLNLSRLLDKIPHLRRLMIKEIPINNLSESMKKMQSIETLYLNDCKIDQIPDTIKNVKELKHLILFYNPLTTLPSAISSLDHLEVFYLENTRYLKTQIFPQVLTQVKSLKKLYLEGGTLFYRIAESISDLINLEILFLNKIATLPESIGDLKKLRVLSLKDSLMAQFPKSVSELNSLKFLDLRGCTELEKLPESLGKLNSLEVLYLDNSKLKNLDIIRDLKNLKVLKLDNLKEIPKSITSLSSLQVLDVSSNEIIIIPEFLKEIPSLKELCISFKLLKQNSEIIEELRKLGISIFETRFKTKLDPSIKKYVI